MHITVLKDDFTQLVEQASTFIDAATPQLEKLASLEAGQEKFAEDTAEALVKANLARRSDVGKIIQEIKSGGFAKISEVIEFVLVKSRDMPSMGKVAAESTPQKPRTSSEVWEDVYGNR